MADETDKPVDRDAWRGLLARGGDEPSELTDARIRTAARRALPTRSARWWLPASLAASMLLAVLVVQWQYEARGPAAVLLESDVAAPAAESEPALPRQDELFLDARPQDGSPPESPTTAITGRSVPQAEAAPGAFMVAPPVVPPPMLDLPAANESRTTQDASADESLRAEVESPTTAVTSQGITRPAEAPAVPAPAAKPEKDLGEIMVTGSRRREAEVESTTPVTQVTGQGVTGGAVGNLQKSRDAPRPPEEWYAEIEKLRAAGQKIESERELEKLEAAWPGWLEKNHPTDR